MKEPKQLYFEILDGKSRCMLFEKETYIKHFSNFDLLEIDKVYNKFFNKYTKQGVLTEVQLFEQLNKNKIWTTEQEKELKEKRDFLANLEKSKKKLFVKSQIAEMDVKIKELSDQIAKDVEFRDSNISSTAEFAAQRRANDYLVCNSFFYDEKLTNMSFPFNEFDAMDAEEVIKILNAYSNFKQDFNLNSLKKIAFSHFFFNQFCLSDNIFNFWGKPICSLTQLQSDLSYFASFYKKVVENRSDIPDDILQGQDPIRLENWLSHSSASDKIKENVSETAASSVMGATKEEIEGMGFKDSTDDFFKKAEENGGVIGIDQLVNMFGS